MSESGWGFLTNHAHVLVCLLRDPYTTLPRASQQVGISKRAVQTIVNDLVAGGYIERTRAGRRNRYSPRLEQPLLQAMNSAAALQQLIGPLLVPKLGRLTPISNRLADQSHARIQSSRSTLEASQRLLRQLRVA